MLQTIFVKVLRNYMWVFEERVCLFVLKSCKSAIEKKFLWCNGITLVCFWPEIQVQILTGLLNIALFVIMF